MRDAHLKAHPTCAACGSKKWPQVHHVRPFHLHPELELDPGNLLTLCVDRYLCHETIGHGDSWRAYNPNVVTHAETCIKHPERRKQVELIARAQRLESDPMG